MFGSKVAPFDVSATLKFLAGAKPLGKGAEVVVDDKKVTYYEGVVVQVTKDALIITDRSTATVKELARFSLAPKQPVTVTDTLGFKATLKVGLYDVALDQAAGVVSMKHHVLFDSRSASGQQEARTHEGKLSPLSSGFIKLG